ncbi:undecaprenyldiphospho-muramoylpentapeptide beta-N-acetylglucosaminyltransferase [Candidatus Peregrinibacteria bacterium]|nr:undecaprenyldiphospho-muramoylpentapeptide beta-N-acetylglucosaminyltransferase [Candidatus Peregrinibacteria bacterium]
MKIILSGGGTGGHIIPNISLLKKLESHQILYIGSVKGMESKLIPEHGVKFEGIQCGKLRRYFSLENFVDFFRTIIGIWQSFWKVKKFNPKVVFCKGGYVSLPVAIGAWIARKPVIIHESDLVPGLANRIAAKFASVICVSFKESKKYLRSDKIIVTGNPVRAELADGKRDKGLKFAGLDGKKPVILVMGGSQGAGFINELIAKDFDELVKNFEIIHLCGQGKVNKNLNSKNYFVAEFVKNEMKDLYAAADLIVTRAGANSLAEIEFLGKPAILIPLIKGSRGDQVGNAEAFANENQVEIIKENVFKGSIIEIAEKLIKSKGKPKKSDAAEIITNLILNYDQ